MYQGETIGSLRAYFAVAALFNGYLCVAALARGPVGVGTAAAILGLLLTCVFAFLAIRLKSLIVSSPVVSSRIMVGVAILGVATAAADLVRGETIAAVGAASSVLVALYIAGNLSRLAQAPVEANTTRSSGVATAVGRILVLVGVIGACFCLLVFVPPLVLMHSTASDPVNPMSIVFLIVLPVAVFGGLAFLGVRMQRTNAASAQPPPAVGSGTEPSVAPVEPGRGGPLGPAAWLPDPSGRHTHRYWDGMVWTSQVADNGVRAFDQVGAG